MIIDTHCHYNLEPLSTDVPTQWQTAQKHGVDRAIVVGTNVETSELALAIAEDHTHLFASIGIHPEVGTELEKTTSEEELLLHTAQLSIGLETLFKKHQHNPKLIAIGETGLDYYRLKHKGAKRERVIATQQLLFKQQLALASEQQLPLILHVRDQISRTEHTAYHDILELLQDHARLHKLPTLILHCVSGPLDYIEAVLSLGGYIGLAGNSTYDAATEIRNIIAITPPDRILLETDAPFLAPTEYRGQVCEPWMIAQTAAFLQEHCQIDLATIQANTLRVFPQLA